MIRHDRGIASVEFALLLPILLLLSVVAAEFGFAFVDWLAVSNSTRTAVRVAASGGDAPTTDAAILSAIEDAMAGAPRATITSVEIYEVLVDGSQGLTQGYPYSGGFGGCSPCGWPAGSRSTVFASLDTVGVRINWTHDWVVGLWAAAPASWSDQEIIRLEPEFGL